MLESLFEPKSIAIVGASRTPGKVGHDVVENLLSSGYQGQILPINPQAKEILGIPCHPDLRSAPVTPELVLIAVPAARVVAAVEQAARAGAGTVVVLSAGFKELGGEGATWETQMAAICRQNRIRLLGPNCLGVINTAHHMNATFTRAYPDVGSIAVVSQSGALCVSILDWARTCGLGISKVVSLGNKADLSEVDFLRALGDDEQTRAIAGYLESVNDGEEFLEAAEQTAMRKPVVLLKVGLSEAGARAAASHTGSLAGADLAYGAAFKRSGVVRADSLESLFDYTAALAMQPLPKGNRVTVIANAGGPGVMTVDAAGLASLEVAPLTDETRAQLRAALPPAAALGNPIDVLGDASPELFGTAFRIVQADPTTDAIIVVVTPQNMTRPLEVADRLAEANDGSKPVLTAFLGGDSMAKARAALMRYHIPDYGGPERAVGALKAMCDYAAWRKRPPRAITRFAVNHRRVERILQWHQRMGYANVGEIAAKRILRAYGFQVPEGSLARTSEEAIEAAEQIGYPVVMKIVSPDILHKSDLGGVRVNIIDREQVRDAFDLMMLRVHRLAPDANIQGVYVERMGVKGREVILGMSRDPQFGPMLMFGLGGIFVEIMKDVTFHLAPITETEAMQMLMGTRSYNLLKGARGERSVDIALIAAGLQRVSQLATDYPIIRELDLNPLIVGEVGTETYVADARMTLAPPTPEAT
jgi:acetyltransferase